MTRPAIHVSFPERPSSLWGRIKRRLWVAWWNFRTDVADFGL